MKRVCAIAALVFSPAIVAAQPTVVVGTGNPDVDVPAVQAAVDQGGEVILQGRFSFNRPPTVPTGTPFAGGVATVLVSTAVVISGTQDGDHERATIEGGTTPFYVEAPGAGVTIQGLRFIRPKGDAILVYAVSGLTIASCKIDGIGIGGADGIDIITSQGIPTPANPGKPENISGTLLIVNNDIDGAGGTAQDQIVGVLLFSMGVPGAEVEVYVSGNTIRNTTEPAMNIRRVLGRVYVEKNVIRTGSVFGGSLPPPPGSRFPAIRVASLGSFLIAHNTIDVGWGHPNAQGIGLLSNLAQWPLEGAFVTDNDINMSPPEGTVFDSDSAGISVLGFVQDNVILNNRIRGRARAALSVGPANGGTPGNNAFVLNRFDDFEASVADIFVGEGVVNTRIVGPGTVEDHGVGTVVERLPNRGRHHDEEERERK